MIGDALVVLGHDRHLSFVRGVDHGTRQHGWQEGPLSEVQRSNRHQGSGTCVTFAYTAGPRASTNEQLELSLLPGRIRPGVGARLQPTELTCWHRSLLRWSVACRCVPGRWHRSGRDSRSVLVCVGRPFVGACRSVRLVYRMAASPSTTSVS